MMGFKINETMVHPMSLCMPHFNIVVVVVFGEEKVRPVMFNDHHGIYPLAEWRLSAKYERDIRTKTARMFQNCMERSLNPD